MNETKGTKPEIKTKRKRTQINSNFSAEEKTQAVLAVWTEKAKAAEVCRQMGVNWITFNQWQQRAMEGMLQALESRFNLSKGEALSPRLQALLRKRQRVMMPTQITSRLEKIQQIKTREETAKGN